MKNFHEKSRVAYNKKAENYNETLDGKFTMKFKEMLIENILLKENDSMLDVACGDGTLLKMISDKKTISGFGIDISDEMVKVARRKCPNMIFKIADCEKIPFDNNSFDAVTVCAAYHHFRNVNLFVKEAKRVLKPGGYIYIAEIYQPTLLRIISNLFLPLLNEGDVRLYSPSEIISTFKEHNFKHINTILNRHIQINIMQS